AERREVEQVVGDEQRVEPSLIRCIGVKHRILVSIKYAEAGHLTFGRPEFACLEQGTGVLEVVLEAARLFVEGDSEVVVEVAPFGREPGEGPAHPRLKPLDFLERRA